MSTKHGADLVILGPFVSTLVAKCHGVSPVVVVCALELAAPHLDDMRYTLEKDAFYPLVEFCYPVVEVRIALQVQPVDLRMY